LGQHVSEYSKRDPGAFETGLQGPKWTSLRKTYRGLPLRGPRKGGVMIEGTRATGGDHREDEIVSP